MDNIHLSDEELKRLMRKKIGSGTDGTVYYYQNGYLIKLYHNRMEKLIQMKSVLQEEIKIYQKGDEIINFDEEPITYYQNKEEDIRLRAKEAIFYAIERQKQIKKNFLPQSAVYIENYFAGCLLKRVYGIPIHKLIGLSFNTKQKICFSLTESIKELLEHNIYPIDISNSPFVDNYYYNQKKLIIQKGHSHVFVNPLTLESKIIDLEGKSTLYTERKNHKYEQKVLENYFILILEFFYDIDMKEWEREEDFYAFLTEHGIEEEFVNLFSSSKLNINEMNHFIRSLKK